MKTFHDAIRQIKFLSQTLSNDKKSLSIFISVGCPLGVKMPKGEWPLIPAIKELTQKINSELLKASRSELKYSSFLEEIKKDGKDVENIEQILSFIRSLKDVSNGGSVRGFSKQELGALEREMCAEIVNLIDVPLPHVDTPYHQLCAWIASIDRESPLEIFTTNYDLLLEQALEETYVPYFDGFVGSRNTFFDLRALEDNTIPNHWTRLWKIHGSLNWYQNGNKVHRSTGNKIKDQESHLIYPSHLKYDQSRKMPYLALIDHLTNYLKKNPALLIICGYSFSDEHLNDSILNALRTNPSSMTIALLYGKLKDYPSAIEIARRRPNLALWAFDEAIIGTKRGRWTASSLSDEDNIGSAINSKEVDVDEGMKETQFELKLGDFAVFGKFLQELIGTKAEI